MNVNIKISVDNGNTGSVHDISVSEKSLDTVLFDFNPSGNADVVEIKALCAALIEKMRDIQRAANTNVAQLRCVQIAITEIEGVQMRAVKALFAR